MEIESFLPATNAANNQSQVLTGCPPPPGWHAFRMAGSYKDCERTLPAPPVTWLGERTVEMQGFLSHTVPCASCPGHGCGMKITPGMAPTVQSENAKALTRQLHFSTLENVGPFFPCIKQTNIITDVLHVLLRIVPVIYRATVSAHHDKREDAIGLSQYIYDTYGTIVSSDTKVQSATGKHATIGTECWPGRTCNTIMFNYEDIMKQVHKPGPNMELCMKVWEMFINWNSEIADGCDDDDQDSRDQHAANLQQIAEEFIRAFVQVGAAEKVTVYMHILLVDIPRQVQRHGSLPKFSAQGVERLHQWMHFITEHRTNRHRRTLAGQVLKGLAMAGESHQTFKPGTGKRKANDAEGHLNQKTKEHNEDVRTNVRMKCQNN